LASAAATFGSGELLAVAVVPAWQSCENGAGIGGDAG
jgi:hypothetical protein